MAYVTDAARGEGPPRRMTPPQIVYVTAVLSRLNDPLYERAVRKVRQLHPYAAILSAKTLWANREGWLATYEAVLAAVTHVYIMANSDRTIGQGLFLELAHFHKLDPSPAVAGVFSQKLKIEPISALDVFGERTPTRFARLVSEISAVADTKVKRAAPKRQAKAAKPRSAKMN